MIAKTKSALGNAPLIATGAQDDGYKYEPVQDGSGHKLAATRTATEDVEPADDRQQHTHDSDKRSLMTCERRLAVDDLKDVRPEKPEPADSNKKTPHAEVNRDAAESFSGLWSKSAINDMSGPFRLEGTCT
ncbi:MAG: hypothetical protein IPH15_11725 [Comamonadaceae bacterium]|nr:hypothetical protein [Comamonadaceae bacterium]